MKRKFTLFFSMLLAIVMLSGCALFNNAKPETPILTQSQQQERIAEISREYVDVVVTVLVVKINTGQTDSFGSGVIVHEDGIIATNYHVIDKVLNDTQNAFKLNVAFDSSDYMYQATIEWNNPSLDLAIIKVEKTPPAFAPMKDRFTFAPQEDRLYTSEKVIAIGTPVSYAYKNTVTLGTVSRDIGRVSHAEGNVYHDLIQHTAFINHGNSGGGLFDLHGNLVGLNTLGHDDAHGLFFAVSIYPITKVLNKVVDAFNNSNKFEIGKIGIQAVDKHEASYADVDFNQDGMLITHVLEDGSAMGKLISGDIILKAQVDESVFDVSVRNHLIYALLETQSGSNFKLKVKRGSQTLWFDLVLG